MSGLSHGLYLLYDFCAPRRSELGSIGWIVSRSFLIVGVWWMRGTWKAPAQNNGIYQAYELALYLQALQKISNRNGQPLL
jgi:hypothetical protein